ncbi:hypothetical protein HC928_00015 [bacterium]|nr:hypothetical protein [bacterium]
MKSINSIIRDRLVEHVRPLSLFSKLSFYGLLSTYHLPPALKHVYSDQLKFFIQQQLEQLKGCRVFVANKARNVYHLSPGKLTDLQLYTALVDASVVEVPLTKFALVVSFTVNVPLSERKERGYDLRHLSTSGDYSFLLEGNEHQYEQLLLDQELTR